MLLSHHLRDFQGTLRFLASGGSSSNLYQGICNIPYHFHLRLIQLIDMSRAHINVNNINLSFRIPLGRRVFYDIIAHSDNQVCFFHDLVLIILLWDAYGPYRIRIVKRDHALCHHGIDDRNLQLCGKLCQFL